MTLHHPEFLIFCPVHCVKLLLLISIACYSVGLFHALNVFVRKQNGLFPVALWGFALGLATHTTSILAQGWEVRRCPLFTYQEVCSFLGWSMAAYFLGAHFWYRSRTFASFAMPMVFLFTLAAWVLPAHNDPAAVRRFSGQMESLLTIHVVFFIFSYAAFAILFLAATLYVIQERQLKKKRFGGLLERLPSLDTCDDLSSKSLLVGFILLSLGILTGIVGSRRLNGFYWHGDPLEFLALATWIIYFCVVHYRLTAGWRGRRAALLGIAGFVVVLISLASIGLLNGFHNLGKTKSDRISQNALYSPPLPKS